MPKSLWLADLRRVLWKILSVVRKLFKVERPMIVIILVLVLRKIIKQIVRK